MHCPNCGDQSALDRKFCRQCGFNLAPVSKLILSNNEPGEPELSKFERDKLIMQRMVRWMMWGMLVLLIGIVFAVVGKQFALGPLPGLIGAIFILGGLSITTYGVLDALRGGAIDTANKKVRAAGNSLETDKAPTTKQLEGRVPMSMPSVTERTTQLIAEDAAQFPGEKL